MKTNYTSNDWKKAIPALIIIFVITFTPVILYVDYILNPLLDGYLIFLNFFIDREIPKQLVNYIIENSTNSVVTEEQGYDMMNVLGVLMIFIVSFILILILIIYFISLKFATLSIWLLKKLNMYPLMNLVLITEKRSYRLIRWK